MPSRWGAGVSEEVLALADGCALVPMLGFVDSYNVSVAAALTLYEACNTKPQPNTTLNLTLTLTSTCHPDLNRV